MYRVTVVLFVLNGVLVSNSLTTKDNQPAATSYDAGEDDGRGKSFGFGFSKKSGYNQMVIATHLSPVPEEVAESYSTYIVHPLNDKRSGYIKIRNEPSLQRNPIVVEDTDDIPNYLKQFPIVVEDEEVAQPQEEYRIENNNRIVQIDDKLNNEPEKDWYEEWFFQQPKGANFDDEIKEIYQKLFGDDPETTSSVGYYKSFKNQFDTFYEGEFKEFFGDDDDEEDKSAKAEKDKEWFTKFPYDYDFEDGSDNSGDKDNNKWNNNYLQEPRYNMRHSYNLHDYDYSFGGVWHEW